MSDFSKMLLVSNFNIDVLSGYLDNGDSFPKTSTSCSSLAPVFSTLIDESLPCWKDRYEAMVVWTDIAQALPNFQNVLNYQKIDEKTLFDDLDQFSDALLKAKNRVKTVFVPLWVLPTYQRGFGMADLCIDQGIYPLLMKLNLRLIENLKEYPNYFVLNTQKWIELAGANAFSSKLQYMAKIPFDQLVFKYAGEDIKAALRGIQGNSKKVLILDLDDTLWGGIVGDDGYENLILGGHDPIGEAFVDFQKALKAMTRRGIILGIVSKNEESVALSAMKNHPEMILKESDFAGWRINWNDKAQNIMDLVDEFNVGLDSVVFIDDNPVERDRVKQVIPEVFVPDWPKDPIEYAKKVLSLNCFDTPQITREDSQRSKDYFINRQRNITKKEMISVDDWLKSLKVTVEVSEFCEVNKQRTVQLLNKTNQMNLTTRRLTEDEFIQWESRENCRLWTFRVSDKFGDSGLTGIASLELNGDHASIVDFILSCRVFGRKIEEMMLATLIVFSKKNSIKRLEAKYLPTEKNTPCLKFFEERSGFNCDKEKNVFVWDFKEDFTKPKVLEV